MIGLSREETTRIPWTAAPLTRTGTYAANFRPKRAMICRARGPACSGSSAPATASPAASARGIIGCSEIGIHVPTALAPVSSLSAMSLMVSADIS